MAQAEGTKDYTKQPCRGGLFFLALLLIPVLTGCSTPPIDKARANFYAGRFAQANENLKTIPSGDKDEILYLNERGMIRQNLRSYDESIADWRQSADINETLKTYSLSKGAISLLTNDRMLNYQGMPFERTLLFTYLAKSYLARHDWDYAAICARNIIMHLENRQGFPDIPYSRYLAGFCMEMINDEGNAAIQYRAASRLLNNVDIDEASGQIAAISSNTAVLSIMSNSPPAQAAGQGELICFIGIGKMPKWNGSECDIDVAPFAELFCGGKYLGRSYPLGNTASLMLDSTKRMAAIQMTKDVTRIIVKEAISESVENQNAALGALTRLVLFSFEVPDTRCWESLPLWLEVARVPCPSNLKNYKVVFKSSGGVALTSKTIDAPISRRGNIFISFCRDIEEPPLKTASP